MPKVFTDPKFWTSIVSLLAAFGVYQIGEISAEQFVEALKILTGIFVGANAVEQGLQKIGVQVVEEVTFDGDE